MGPDGSIPSEHKPDSALQGETDAYGVRRCGPAESAMLEEVEKAHFQYFKQQSDPLTGLTRDRSTPDSPSSIAAVGFSLTAYPVAAQRGWINRDEAADYTLKVLKTLWAAPQGDNPSGESGTHGFFYHFLDPKTGLRSQGCEVSTVDTALLMSGILFDQSYFDGKSAKEAQIRDLADKLYRRVDWNWVLQKDGRLSMGWTPEKGFIKSEWKGYNEGSILLLMGLGSPTHPLPAPTWNKFMSTDRVKREYGQKFIEFGPLFGHESPQIWVDFRGIQDKLNRKHGFDYFENSRRATIAQHEYAIHNPHKWRGYSALDWGLTASDGPGEATRKDNGRRRQFHSYAARGFPDSMDDGTIAPTAAIASVPFAPELVMPTINHWMKDRREIFGTLGFADAFNPTFDPSKPSGWVDPDRLGLDQGPSILMIENYRSEFVWQVMKRSSYLNTALARAGFHGGWLQNNLYMDPQKDGHSTERP